MSSEKNPIELPLDQYGRPYLPPPAAFALALKNGYEGADGADLGAHVRPEDVGSFAENAARIDQPAHFEQVVITPPIEKNGGYTGLNADNPITPNISVDEALAINQANALAAEQAAQQAIEQAAELAAQKAIAAAEVVAPLDPAVEVTAAEVAPSETISAEAEIPAPPTEAPAEVTAPSTEGAV